MRRMRRMSPLNDPIRSNFTFKAPADVADVADVSTQWPLTFDPKAKHGRRPAEPVENRELSREKNHSLIKYPPTMLKIHPNLYTYTGMNKNCIEIKQNITQTDKKTPKAEQIHPN